MIAIWGRLEGYYLGNDDHSAVGKGFLSVFDDLPSSQPLVMAGKVLVNF